MKKNLMTFILIVVLSIISIAVVGLIYSLYFRSSIREQYELVYAESLNNSKVLVDDIIDTAFSDMKAASGGIPDGYYAVGRLDASTKNLTLNAPDRNPNTYITLSTEEYNKIIGQTAKNYSGLHMSTGNYFGKMLAVYCQKSGNEGEYYLMFQEYADFTAQMKAYALENIVIVDINGYVYASIAGGTFDEIYKSLGLAANGDISLLQNGNRSIDGTESLLLAEKLNNSNLYLLGHISTDKIDALISKEIKNNTVFVVIVCMLSFLGATVIITIFLMLSNTYITGTLSKTKYSIFVSKNGKILRKNKKFREEFEQIATVYGAMENEFNETLELTDKDVVFRMKNKNEETVYVRFMSSPTMYGFKLLGSDVTQMSLEYLKAKFLSNCDALTRLPNMSQLELDYDMVKRSESDEQLVVQYIEMTATDHYKEMFGTEFYDKLKLAFAERLAGTFPGMVYHLGEIRFLLFGKTTADTQYLSNEISDYTAQLEAPFHIDTQHLLLTFKGGRSKPFSSKDEVLLDDMISQAYHALQSALNSADKKIVGFFDALTQSDATLYSNRQSIIDLINDDMLMLNYQPQYSLKSDKIVGFEALMRLKKKINISILEFIEHAERNGGIIEVGLFAIRTALAFAKKIEKHKITISINVSPVQLMQEGFVESFLEIYKASGLKPHSIAVEITESFLMTNYNRAITLLNLLNRVGIDIHLDDFGVVYSSMLYLKKLPINTIKIDREFVKDINFNGYSKMIVEIISKSTKFLKLQSIAEGVETEDQMKTLRSLECDTVQGHYISRAVPEDEAIKLIEKYLEESKNK